MNEAETRAEHVDPALREAGWGVIEGSKILREYSITPGRIEGLGRRGRSMKADYVLVYRNRKLAVLEAKAWDKPLSEGVGQAKDYAGKMALRFPYATNGQGLYGIDMESGQEGELPRYPTPDELWAQTFAKANVWRDRFAAVPFEDKGGSHCSRYYQDIAVERVLDAIATGKQRILLTLATGTGKTFIAFQLAWKLFQSRWNLRREPSVVRAFCFWRIATSWPIKPTTHFRPFPRMRWCASSRRPSAKKARCPKTAACFSPSFRPS